MEITSAKMGNDQLCSLSFLFKNKNFTRRKEKAEERLVLKEN